MIVITCRFRPKICKKLNVSGTFLSQYINTFASYNNLQDLIINTVRLTVLYGLYSWSSFSSLNKCKILGYIMA